MDGLLFLIVILLTSRREGIHWGISYSRSLTKLYLSSFLYDDKIWLTQLLGSRHITRMNVFYDIPSIHLES